MATMIHHYKNATAFGVFFTFVVVLATKLRLVDGFQPSPPAAAMMRTTSSTHTQLGMSKNRRHGKKNKNKKTVGMTTTTTPTTTTIGNLGGSLTPSVVDKNHPSVESAVLDPVHIDLQHAKDVVDHFGDYTVEQIQQMRDGTYLKT